MLALSGRRGRARLLAVFAVLWRCAAANALLGGGGVREPPHALADSLTDQSAYVSLGDVGSVVAVGDLDRDRFVDALLIDRYARSFSAALWRSEEYHFEIKDAFSHAAGGDAFGSVAGVALGDFDNDGVVDVLVVDDRASAHVYLNRLGAEADDGGGRFVHAATLQPFDAYAYAVLDADGDRRADVFVALNNGSRGFFVPTAPPPSAERDGAGGATAAAAPPLEFRFHAWRGHNDSCPPAPSHPERATAAFVDLDGDCLSELVLTSGCGLEVWHNAPHTRLWELSVDGVHTDSGGGRAQYRLLPRELWDGDGEEDGVLSFGDVTGDGANDIVFANRRRKDVTLLVNSRAAPPPPAGALCSAADWKLTRSTIVEDIDLADTQLSRAFRVAAGVRLGDFDRDGLLDLVAVDRREHPIVYVNRGAGGGPSADGAAAEGGGGGDAAAPRFERLEAPELAQLDHVVAATFFDVDDSGRQDILLSAERGRTRLMWNQYGRDSDSLYFKGTALSALSFFQQPHPFAPVAGHTFKLRYDDELGPQYRTCSQCSLSMNLPLQACNCYFALRRVVNYVREMDLGGGGESRAWQYLIPNSMAIVWLQSGDSADGWWMEYFTQRRGGHMLGIVLVLAGCLLVLGAVVLLLSWRERREDRMEKLRNSEVFGFALS